MGAHPNKKKRLKKQDALAPDFEYLGDTQLPDPKHELFCQLYTSNTTPRFFGHGQNCYIFAYGYSERLDEIATKMVAADPRKGRGKKRTTSELEKLTAEKVKIETTCRTNGARLLTSAYILARCNHLMDKLIDDGIVDRELAFVIQQRGDLSSKTSAIIHYDKKRGRITDKQQQLIKFEPITQIEYIVPKKPK